MRSSMTENTAPEHRGRFRKGQSGNPAGKPKGARHRVTLAAEALLDGEAEGLSRKAVELALQGDTVALRLCLERILPPRKDRPAPVRLPTLETAADAAQATAAIVQAVAAGELTPSEATELSKLVEIFARTLEVSEFETRLAALEQRLETRR